MKQKIVSVLRYLLAIFMVYAGIQHFIKPEFYTPFVPSFLPYSHFFIMSSGLVEVVLGLLLFFRNKYATYGALGIFLLMLVFLPIHIKDVLVENPAIGSHKAAIIRLPIQILFLVWSWAVYQFTKKNLK
ncbi:DoxX family protein [Riemerella columbina]|uniref:DoxX family protein n=1 Tax=Riemerella columbina TaxID=103810 RepID=UPI00037CF95F|nr:MauE/DoxX family redox-associated membrane protein [Riemerella columbina]